MLKIIVTGGIGSGKSSAVDLFRKYDIPVIDTDEIARKLSNDPAVLKELTDSFGIDIINPAGQLDRRALRNIVFSDKDAREKLQNLLHPKIYQQVLANLADLETGDAPYCLIVIPLFTETGRHYPHDRVLVIDISEQNQLARASQRDNQATEQIKQIIDSQASHEQRLAIADDVIDNNGDINLLKEQVEQLHQQYMKLA